MRFISFLKDISHFIRSAWFRELLLWCLPALICGGIARGLLLGHFPYGFVHPDTPDFLFTSAHYFTDHTFALHQKRTFLEPILFLFPMLAGLPSLLVIPWEQHICGLVYTIGVGALVRTWTVQWRYWIVPATLLTTLNPSVLYYEHTLIAEFDYLFCVTALALAGSVFALKKSPGYFALLLVTLFLTAGSRPEGKLYFLFCLILVPLLFLRQWRRLAIYGGITLVCAVLGWRSTRDTEAGSLLYTTLLPLAPDTPRAAPDFGPVIAPLRADRLAKGMLFIPDLLVEQRRVNAATFPWLRAKGQSTRNFDRFFQRLGIEAALHRPLLVPVIALEKFLLGTEQYDDEGFEPVPWLQDVQIRACSFKLWMLDLMPRLTGRPIHTRDDVIAYVHQEFPPLNPDWFARLQGLWYHLTTGARVPWDQPMGTPGIPLFYLLAAAGVGVAVCRPGPMRSVHIAFASTLGFTATVVMLTGVINPRYRFVFEPFALLYLFILCDGVAGLLLRMGNQNIGEREVNQPYDPSSC